MPRLCILMYHIVDHPRAKQEAKYCCLPDQFRKQMRYLSQVGYELLNLNDVFAVITNDKKLTSDAVTITFDDGFEDFFHQAMPVLSEFAIPATLFMVSNRIGKTNDWMHLRGSPKRNLLSGEQLRELARSRVLIGSHTMTHPKLTDISNNRGLLVREIGDAKMMLEDKLGLPVRHFAYPYGLFDDQAKTIVEQSGYATACSTRAGFNRRSIDRYALRRIEIYGGDNLWRFKQKLKFGTNDMNYLFPAGYYMNRILSRFGSSI